MIRQGTTGQNFGQTSMLRQTLSDKGLMEDSLSQHCIHVQINGLIQVDTLDWGNDDHQQINDCQYCTCICTSNGIHLALHGGNNILKITHNEGISIID